MSDRSIQDSPKQVFIYTRSHPRYQTSIYARVEGEKHLRESRGNVSAGGFCFEAQEELPPGTQVELLFRLPGAGVWLKGRGQVLASMESADTVAVRGMFTAIDLGELGNINQWVDSFLNLHLDSKRSDKESQEDPREQILFSTTIDC